MKSAKWDMPLSKRAYGKILEKAMIGVRIAGREDDFDEFIDTINLYITKGKVSMPWGDYHDIYDIIFHLIKDDIDTAMRRSREARERAASRRRDRMESPRGENAREETRRDETGAEDVSQACGSATVMASATPPCAPAVHKPQRGKKRHKGRRYDELCNRRL